MKCSICNGKLNAIFIKTYEGYIHLSCYTLKIAAEKEPEEFNKIKETLEAAKNKMNMSFGVNNDNT